MSAAGDICRRGAAHVEGARQETHGDALAVYADLAAIWNAYLGDRLAAGHRLSAKDAALMMVLLKVSRTKHGRHNPDNYEDAAGYAGLAGFIAGLQAGEGA
ncbi:DUF6378 domain-containing protein [Shumkonia mesophila]|uniref:DUF6378 domain-containing protein n=1 Tax=Shumkonia mesophila TaxID=2838854 RepID=UPI0029352D55|nr:DUF6378 domain-containing protein [Shumkonia mesophila]